MPDFARGDVFVGHRIETLAGRGGMGVVYRATQLDLDRLVALKVIAPALAEDPDFRARFIAESRSAASIEHPNVLPVYSAGEHDGVLYIVMRYVDGPDLRALVRANEGLDPERAAHIVAQVGAALDAAHRHGLVHRDVKPANVLIDADDHAYLTDFGLTKRITSSVDLSRSGSWVGTLGYVAPEQIRGAGVDARTDVYALGCVLVHALTGSAPYVRESDEATMWAHLNSPPPTDSVPVEFEGVVARALAKDPSDRYPSAGDLGRAALTAAGRSGVAAPERIVARGAARPDGVAGPLDEPDAETRPSPPHDARDTRVAAPRERPTQRARGPRWLPVAVGLAAVVGVAAVLLSGGGDGGNANTHTATMSQALTADPAIALVTRPNSLTFSGSDLAVLSARSGELVVVDATTGTPGARISVGSGASAVESGFGSLWVTKFRTNSLLQVQPGTLRRPNPAIKLPTPGPPIGVVAGERAVWVGTHEQGGVDHVVKIDPRRKDPPRLIRIIEGLQDLAVGDGAVWVTNRSRSGLTRVDVRDGSQRSLTVGREPHGLAVGEGAVWVAGSKDDTITRVDTKTLATQTIQLNVTPERVAVGGGSVWVTAQGAASLIRIDADTRKVVATIPTGHGPFAVGVYRDRAVWLTLVGDNAIQRVRFSGR